MHGLWWLSVFLQVSIAVRLYRLGLWRKYRVFFFCLLIAAFKSLFLFPIDPNSRLYMKTWGYSELVTAALNVAVVGEICWLTASRYPKFGRSAWTVLGILLLLAVCSTLLTGHFDHTEDWRYLSLKVSILKRYLAAALACFLLYMTAFLGLVSVSERANVRRYRRVAFAYFSAQALTRWAYLLNSRNEVFPTLQPMMIAACVCYGFWFFAFRTEGEEVRDDAAGLTVYQRQHGQQMIEEAVLKIKPRLW